ncbi:hypothetical protein NDU88_006902 [Pleurodeles waltl]|uniref:G-protein coupled receptors family 1 profile domain-containing protein n=1 Tax=Pleurodeles waltl TaxID=8319 RepID=A0AAV7LQH9_PLEWA|nr:hypothetical protein NDU88_006902 [Pleurodeles waltl]
MVPLAVNPDSFGNILLILFHVCLATIIVLLNLGVFLCIAMTRSLRKENRFLYMMSTCISDFFTGATWYYVGIFDVHEGFPKKNDIYYFSPTFLGLSYLVVIAAQADRYHAVTSPIRYLQRMTLQKTLVVLTSLWALSFLTLVAQNLLSTSTAAHTQSIGTLVMNFIALVIMLGLNIRLFLIAKYQLERDPPTPEREAKRSSLYLIIVVAASFLFLWSPVFLRVIICNFMPIKCRTETNSATNIVVTLPRINAALTPLLYVRGCTPLQEVVFSRVCCYCSSCCKALQ